MDEQEKGLDYGPVDPEPAPEPNNPRLDALRLLDFHAIRWELADHTTFFPARQLALQLTPSYDISEVDELQDETAEGVTLLQRVGHVSLYSGTDTSQALARVGLQGLLTGMELLSLADSLEVQRRARLTVLRASRSGVEIPLLSAVAEMIPELDELPRQIRSCIGPRGEVVDDATPNLRALRVKVRHSYETVTRRLKRVIQSSVGQETLQDQVISVRGDRLVIQVKAEMRHRLPGIVHDASNTGATLFVEPFATVELCNDWRESTLEEEREVKRVLGDLSILVGTLADDIRRGNELAARLDFILSRARYSEALHGTSASQRRPPGRAKTMPGNVLRLLNSRHPMLDESAVPVSVNIGPDWSVLVITGPNTGGKTVAMKTLGLLALMHQSGLHIPADDGSLLPVFDGVYADVGDQQSIERSVSTFSSHMRNVIGILAEAGPDSLVLLDELGTSTDPEEGSALAKAILDNLASRGIRSVVTTHHQTVAAFAESTPEMKNASVDLDPATLEPTYHLTMGIAGRSYAMSVASRLGLPEDIMSKAQELLEPQHRRFEDWLNELQSERHRLQTRVQEAEEARAKIEVIRQNLETQLEYLGAHREEILDSVRRELMSRYDDVSRKIRRAEAALSWAAPDRAASEPRIEVSRIKRELEALKPRIPVQPTIVEERTVSAGELVNIRGLNLQGTVVSVSEQSGEAEVSIGKVRLRMDMARLSLAGQPAEAESVDVRMDLGPMLSSMELDLRGLRVEEALLRVEDFLDKAVRDGLSTARIIHGRGTGALRQAVRDLLTHHTLAQSFAPEAPERGGNGATVVELA